MTTDNKTLADVQPGGRVRLGDGLPPLPEFGINTANHASVRVQGFTPEQMLNYARATLSAQPSPGGQGEARIPFETWAKDGGFDVSKFKGIYNSLETRAAWEAWLYWQRLAARQPVTIDDALAAGDSTLHGAIDHWQERALRAEAELASPQPVGEPVAWMTHHDEPMLFPTAAEAAAYCEDDEQPVPLFRSPAQAVDLGAVREAVRKAWQKCAAGESVDLQFGTLLALIDKAVGK